MYACIEKNNDVLSRRIGASRNIDIGLMLKSTANMEALSTGLLS